MALSTRLCSHQIEQLPNDMVKFTLAIDEQLHLVTQVGLVLYVRFLGGKSWLRPSKAGAGFPAVFFKPWIHAGFFITSFAAGFLLTLMAGFLVGLAKLITVVVGAAELATVKMLFWSSSSSASELCPDPSASAFASPVGAYSILAFFRLAISDPVFEPVDGLDPSALGAYSA